MHSQASIEIDRPIKQVFELTNDHVQEWSRIVVEEETIEETESGVGTTFRVVTEDRGNRMEFDGVVTHYDEPYASTIEMHGEYFDIRAEYTFEDLGARTLVTQRSEVTGKGFIRVMFFLFGWLMKRSSCKAAMQEMEHLKTYCEAN